MAAPALSGTALSEREVQWLHGAARGLSDREIGAELYLALDTAKSHGLRAMRKLEVHDRTHAVVTALRSGVIALDGIEPPTPAVCEREHIGPAQVSIGAREADARRLAVAWCGGHGEPPPTVLQRARETLVRLVAGASR